MSALFSKPKPEQIPPPVDPASLQNRSANQRLARLDQGGPSTTLLSQAMSSQLGGPRATLTGMG